MRSVHIRTAGGGGGSGAGSSLLLRGQRAFQRLPQWCFEVGKQAGSHLGGVGLQRTEFSLVHVVAEGRVGHVLGLAVLLHFGSKGGNALHRRLVGNEGGHWEFGVLFLVGPGGRVVDPGRCICEALLELLLGVGPLIGVQLVVVGEPVHVLRPVRLEGRRGAVRSGGQAFQREVVRMAAGLPVEEGSQRAGRLLEIAGTGERLAADRRPHLDRLDLFVPLDQEKPANGEAQEDQEEARQVVHVFVIV